MHRTVWAPDPLPELNHAVGFVVCAETLAEELIAQDLVQDPRIGAHLMRCIGSGGTGTYRRRDLVAESPKKRGRPPNPPAVAKEKEKDTLFDAPAEAVDADGA
jgi:hypothetical protein